MQVVGKRHFGLKALAQGGGGGRQATRELFDTLLLWKGRLFLNDLGEARMELPLNDSISAFRIVAVATGDTGMFGTGSAVIQSAQDLAIFSGLPPLVREGDAYRAGVTVRNASLQPMGVKLSARAAGLGALPAFQSISLLPGEAKEIGWDVTAPAGVDTIPWEIDAVADAGAGQDRIRLVQQVLPAVPVRVLQATLSQVEGDYSVPIAPPKEALAGGGIRAGIRARLADSQSAVTDYMKHYPYGCLEQKISTAVALRDKALWDHWMARISAYMDADGLAKYFPVSAAGDPVLTAYLIAISQEAGWPLPEEFFQKAASALRKFVEGSIVRNGALPSADLTLRKLSAIEALSRIGKADPGLLGAIVIEPDAWPTSAVIDWVNILTSLDPPRQKEMRMEAEQILRSRLSYQGTVMGFSTENSDRLCQLMVSGDVNAVRLVLTALRLSGWEPDIWRLVRGALGRQKAGRWDLTTANAWGVLAMEKFSQRYEPEPVTGETVVALSDQVHRCDWGVFPQGSTAALSWPVEESRMTAVHQGQGKPWLLLQSLAAIPLKAPVSRGYEIKKSLSAVEQKTPDRWNRGDILRVRLEISAQSDMTWVAVTDPVPAGAAILGTGLKRDSNLLTRGENQKSNVWPAFEERSLSAFRAYFDYAPKGAWMVEYTLRLNQSGTFQLPPTRVEALYAPEMYGEAPNAVLEIGP
jgi:uncharacterized protein YfaS (alpha-2-macroglobulin family)